ncbi:DgyrCDS11079 [Dimorphilus gyrociliatus]|uniref:DgyrCDS11079 n=1 Tax=Dimorphilus gyrociliatus TaxID=2664684 RepID=A0A7I8W4S1_9ANNE|nr:DgyrCDS11079 [Dimorphilus gyrociliatus]
MAVNIVWQDILIIAFYFVIVFAVGIYASCKASTDSAQGYFLAGQSSNWLLIGASTFATNIGAPMFIGIAGSAASSGISIVMFEWHAMFMLVALGWLFLPVYRACGCYTMPHYLQKRFGGKRIRLVLAIAHTLLTIISQVAGQMFAGALFMRQIFGWNLYLSVVLILAVTAIYTIGGGLTAVLWTDTIQTVILIAGSAALSGISLNRVGGFANLRWRYDRSYSNNTAYFNSYSNNLTCGLPKENAWNIFRPLDEDNPWLGMIIGLTILATNAWCTDQLCVQRSLSAKSISHAKGGVLLAAFLKITPFLFFVIPGMVSRVLFPDEIACSDPEDCKSICGNVNGCSNIAYPLLVVRIMPIGVRGLMLAALLAALISSLTSIFNSATTVFTMDIWRVVRKRAEEKELMLVSRLFTVLLIGISIAWLPILENIQGSQFWDYIQQIYSYILPPIVMVFLAGIFWNRTTEMAAFLTLLICITIGLARMIMTFAMPGPPCGSTEKDNRWPIISKVHYLHFAIILGGLSLFLLVGISIITKPRPMRKLHRTTFWTRNDKEFPEESEDENENENAKPIEKEIVEETEENVTPDRVTKGQRIKQLLLKYVCGQNQNSNSQEGPTKEEIKKMTSIVEDPKSKLLLDLGAAVCVGVAIFLHGFWA